MAGGYREGSGRSKTGYYKGVYCGSTYELCWVIHALDHGILFQRFPGCVKRDDVTYYPDFLLGDGKTIIECKGFESQQRVDKKSAVAEYHGYNVQVLRKDDLKFAFDYVTAKYNTTQYAVLYDGYKPLYEYTCSHCSSSISSHTKRDKAEVFCNRVCSGRRRTQNQKNVIRTENNKYVRKLSKQQALEIFESALPYESLADIYGVSRGAISHIKTKRSYGWIHSSGS